MNLYCDTLVYALSQDALQSILMEPKFKDNSRKDFVNPNILEVHGSRIRIESKSKKNKNKNEYSLNHYILTTFAASEQNESSTST